MDSINRLLNGTEEQPMKLSATENPMQGLYFDLLCCLSGGDHPRLPQGYKLKPMTGFLDIVEAFNDVAKLHAAGSGIVCEVGSNEFVENNPLSPASKDALETKQSDQNTATQEKSEVPYDSYSLPHSNHNNQRETFHDCAQHTVNYKQETELQKDDSVVKALPLSGEHNDHNQWKILHESNINVETFHDALDTFKIEYDQDSDVRAEMESQNLIENENEMLMKQPDYIYANPHYHEQAELNLSSCDLSSLNSAREEIRTMEKEIVKYSEELKEIELMLKQHLAFPNDSQQQRPKVGHPNALPSLLESPTHELQPNLQFVDGRIVQELADGLMSPSSALEMMYDMESNGSSRNPPSAHTSTYESCTSFTSWQNQPSVNCFFDSNNSSIGKMMQFSQACPNEPSLHDYVQFKTTSDSVNSASLYEKVPVTDHFFERTESETRDRENGFHLLSDMVNKFTTKTDINANDVSYYSVNAENDKQESVDAENSTQDERKRKIRFCDKLPTLSERNQEWSSASCSENDEANNAATS